MASKRWKDDIAYAMTPFMVVSWPLGVWPLQDYNIFSLIRCVFGVWCSSVLVILPIMEFYLGCTDAEMNVDCLMLSCCGALAMLKTTFYRIYASNLIDNYDSAVKDYMTIENEEERAIMRRHAFTGRILCCSVLSFSYFSCGIYVLMAIMKSYQINTTDGDIALEYPLPSNCGMEYLNTPRNLYHLFFFIQTTALLLTNAANHGNDSVLFNITLHICGQVEILKTNLVNINVASPQIHEHFNALIQRHTYLIRMTGKLVGTVNFILLMQLFVTSILLCIMGFQFILALKVNDFVMVTKSMMVYFSFLLQLTIYCFIGDYLKSQMEEIGHSLYQSAWRDLPIKLKRRLIFILMRTDTPVALIAGNFIAINLPTYMTIVKTSLSSLSVLRVMVEDT